MFEVTDENFQSIYKSEIESAIKNASFIAIDTEFTGMKTADYQKVSLFDSIQERYEILRESIKPYIVIQFGLTTFESIKEENSYKAKVFNFYLQPRSIPAIVRKYSWQTAAIEFFISYGFDFNKALYHGIPYVNEIEEAALRKEIFSENFLQDIDRGLLYKDEDDLRIYTNLISNWLSSENDNDKSKEIRITHPVLQYLAHKEFRRRFPNVWTLPQNKSLIVIKVTNDARDILEEQEGTALENSLLEYQTGFSKIFKLLVDAKKPIVGHNLLLDLMFMYQQFYKPLPSDYSDFKKNVHTLFPGVYDTKFLSFELRNKIDKDVCWKSNSLSSLYVYFKEQQGQHLSFNSPIVQLQGDSPDVDKVAHTAGWDAYFTGYVFIKMAHIFAVQKFGSGYEMKPITNTEIMNGVKDYRNCVNVIRGSISYLKLDGPDPQSTRPEWLLVKPLNQNVLNLSQIAERFTTFGPVDVKPFAFRKVLVAVANHGSAEDILRHFKRSKEFYVTPYNKLKHSVSIRLFLWSGVILSGTLFTLLINRQLQKGPIFKQSQ